MLQDFSAPRFLREHWQRKPLLLRGALPRFRAPIDGDELAGLACEEDVESRLVQGALGEGWRLQHGPFEEAAFDDLPDRDWTLLVQDVDKLVPEVARLLAHFRFLPDWRLDDIMVSFSAPGGSVGPHTDRYDVFLLQAQGKRRWQWSEHFDPALEPDCDLKILRRFVPEREEILRPGDILYLPPGVAHYGVALEAGLTFSIGLRSPDGRQLVAEVAQTLLERLPAEPMGVADPGRDETEDPFALEARDLERLRKVVREQLRLGDEELDDSLARLLTQPKPQLAPRAAAEVPSLRELAAQLATGATWCRAPGSRFTHLERGGRVCLFIGGSKFEAAPATLAWIRPLLCAELGAEVELGRAPDQGALHLLHELLALGLVEPSAD